MQTELLLLYFFFHKGMLKSHRISFKLPTELLSHWYFAKHSSYLYLRIIFQTRKTRRDNSTFFSLITLRAEQLESCSLREALQFWPCQNSQHSVRALILVTYNTRYVPGMYLLQGCRRWGLMRTRLCSRWFWEKVRRAREAWCTALFVNVTGFTHLAQAK